MSEKSTGKDQIIVDQKKETAQPDSKEPTYTEAEKKNILADQKVNVWSNEETATKHGVSEATIRRWEQKVNEKKPAANKPVTKRPKVKARKSPVQPSQSVTRIKEQLASAKAEILLLKEELAVIKPVARFYLK